MDRSEFRAFAMRLLVGATLIALGALLAFARSHEGLPNAAMVVLFLGQLLFAFAGLALFLWAIGSVFWDELKRLVDWTSKE